MKKHSFFDKIVFSLKKKHIQLKTNRIQFKKSVFSLTEIVFTLKTRSKFPWWARSAISIKIQILLTIVLNYSTLEIILDQSLYLLA